MCHSEMGTVQGRVISPLLANIYLHEVMDVWFEREIRPVLGGQSFLTRYADDVVLVLERGKDARRVMEVLPKRFGKFGLKLHPDKTRVVRFIHPSPRQEGGMHVRPTSESFDLLDFTHYWGKSWKGCWVIKRRTAKSRFTRAVKGVHAWCWTHRHLPLVVQHTMLVRKLLGHFNSYGITGNYEALARF